MLLVNLICAVLVAMGAILFLYGANVYNDVFGWAGIGLFIVGIVISVVFNLSIYLEKKKNGA
jgi:membrane-bound ClpP family serine protease